VVHHVKRQAQKTPLFQRLVSRIRQTRYTHRCLMLRRVAERIFIALRARRANGRWRIGSPIRRFRPTLTCSAPIVSCPRSPNVRVVAATRSEQSRTLRVVRLPGTFTDVMPLTRWPGSLLRHGVGTSKHIVTPGAAAQRTCPSWAWSLSSPRETAMHIIKPNRATHTHRQRLHAVPTKVFPLLCPVRETEWTNGWLPELVISRDYGRSSA